MALGKMALGKMAGWVKWNRVKWHWVKWNWVNCHVTGKAMTEKFPLKDHARKRDPRQIWIARGKESSISIWNFLGLKRSINSFFNYTAAVSANSTFRDSYFEVVEKKEQNKTMSHIEKEYDALKKDKEFCWMVSNCRVFNKRFELAAKIINALPGKIHIWGKAASVCMPKANKSKIVNHGVTKRNTAEARNEFKKCKFYFAFENSNCSDYVTEKFSNSLFYYAIPIVNGWRESYEKQLPGSFIHAADFYSPVQLGEYLSRLLAKKAELLSYHKWRLRYDVIREDNLSMFNLLSCKVCEKVHKTREINKKALTYVETIPELSETFSHIQQCVPR